MRKFFFVFSKCKIRPLSFFTVFCNFTKNINIFQFLGKIGVLKAKCVDVYGFDEELINFIPKPHLALILCYPDYKKVDEIMKPVYDKLQADGAAVPENIFFMKQKISNACGTFALFHSLANLGGRLDLGKIL